MIEITEDEFYDLSEDERIALFNTSIQEAEDELRSALKILNNLESLFYYVYHDEPWFRRMWMLKAMIEKSIS